MISRAAIPPALRSLYREGRLVPFVGAGVSMSVSWPGADGRQQRGPSWSQLVDEAARILHFSDAAFLRCRGSDLQILEYFKLAKAGSFAHLTNWLVMHMSAPDDALRASPIHTSLAALSRCRTFYTTNYDDFLERSFELCGRRARPVVVENDMGSHSGGVAGECEVVKFHGDWNYPSQMVLSESQYEERLALDGPMDLRFRSDMLGRAALFIGYSFRDPNVAYLFRTIKEKLGPLPTSLTGRRAYILVADPSDFEARLFAERNIEVVPVHGSCQTQDVSELLSELEA